MKQKTNVYRRLIETALAMPKYEPPKYEPTPPLKSRLVKTLTRTRSIRQDAELAYNFIVSTAKTRTTLSKRVPVSKLHSAMAAHVMKFTGEAIMRGGLPLRVFIVDRFAAFLDFGEGRVLKIGVRIEEKPSERSLARFVVEQASEKDFEMLDLGFDPVEQYEYDKKRKETKIESAVIWHERESNQNNLSLGDEAK